MIKIHLHYYSQTLLHEKQINPLHPWDTSLPLFISDPRYVLLPSVSSRREAFDEYCRDAARAQRSAKAAAFKEESRRMREDDGMAGEGDKDKEAYSRLLPDEVTSTRATWHEFRRKWKKDRRFFGWAGDRERERVFREWVKDLGKGEPTLPVALSHGNIGSGSASAVSSSCSFPDGVIPDNNMHSLVKKKVAEKAEREFFQLLREHRDIKPGDVWREARRRISFAPHMSLICPLPIIHSITVLTII